MRTLLTVFAITAVLTTAAAAQALRFDPETGRPMLRATNTGTTVPATNTYTDEYNYNVGTSFSAPIVAGILVGVLVAGIGDGNGVPWPRKLALMYLLIGSLATALGTIQAPNSWFYAAFFVIICGSLAASVCLAAQILIGRSTRTTGGGKTGRPARTDWI